MALRRYFIAIIPPEEILAKAEQLKLQLFNEHGLKGSLKSPAHITLHMPFEWEEEKEGTLIRHLQRFQFGSAIPLELNGFGCFEPRVLFIRVMDHPLLFGLYNSLRQHVKLLQIFNETDNERGFHPHMTIAFRDLKKPLFYELWPLFKVRPFSATFTCSRIHLLKFENKWEIAATFDI